MNSRVGNVISLGGGETGPPSLLNDRWYCKVCLDSESDQIQKATDAMGRIEYLCNLIAGVNGSEFSTAVDPDGFDIDDPESPINALAKSEERCRVLEEACRIGLRATESCSSRASYDGNDDSEDYWDKQAKNIRAALEVK